MGPYLGEEDEGVAAGLSEMEAEFREREESGSWRPSYRVDPPGKKKKKKKKKKSRWKWTVEGEADTFFFKAK